MEIVEFQDKLKTLEQKIFKTAWGHERPSDQLFHYTSPSGLKGILTSGVVWATDLTFMNDEQELSYGNELMEQLYNDKLTKHSVDVASALLKYQPTLFSLRSNFKLYAFCLTELGDDEDSWKNYADSGQGGALQFDLGKAEWNRILQVFYKLHEQEAIFHKVIDPVLEFADDNPTVLRSEDQRRDLGITIQKALAMCTLRFKSTDWEKEKEWRFIGGGEPDGYRTKDGKEIPYQEFPLETLIPLRSVLLGPCRRGANETGQLLEAYPSVRIMKSSISCSELDS